jgi:gamma-glutamylputrescine oxidase
MTEHVRSWYAASANPHAPFPRFEGEARCDVAVVGGGYTGLSAALHLAERGYDVILLEGQRIGWGASGRNGGQVVTAYNRSMAQLEGWVGKDDARKLWDMNEEAKSLLRDRVARHDIRCDLKWGYILAALKRRHVAELRETLAEWRAYGYEQARMLSRAETRQLVSCEQYVGGLLDSGSGQLHPLNYALGLAEAARQAGARLYEDSLVQRLDQGDPCVLHTARGKVTANHVILAGNAYLNRISPDVDRIVRPKIMPVSTYMIATEPLGENRAAAVLPGDMAVADINFVLNYYRLSADKRMLFGGGVSYSNLNRPDMQRVMRRTMLKFFPSLADVRIEYCWHGFVGITINRTPHFGRVAPNVYFAHGFSGHGVALTGLAGKLMAEAVAGTAERFDVFARIPHRPFPGGRLFRMPALVLAMAWYRLRDLL